MKAQSRKFIVATSAISIMALSYAAFNQSNTNPTAPVKTNSINQSTTNSLSTTSLSVATPKLKSTIQAPTNSNTPIKNQYIVVLNTLSELPSTAAKKHRSTIWWKNSICLFKSSSRLCDQYS